MAKVIMSVKTKNIAILIVFLFLLILGGVLLLQNQAQQNISSSNTTVTAKPTLIPSPTPRISPLQEGEIKFSLMEQNNSRQKGVASLLENNKNLLVSLAIEGSSNTASQPANIAQGTCWSLGKVVYKLSNVSNGISQTTLNVTLKELDSKLPLSIIIYSSQPNTEIVACGNILPVIYGESSAPPPAQTTSPSAR